MSASKELQIGHVIDGNLSMPKNSCFLALPMYCPVRNLSRLVFCESVIAGLDQKLLDISLSMLGTSPTCNIVFNMLNHSPTSQFWYTSNLHCVNCES